MKVGVVLSQGSVGNVRSGLAPSLPHSDPLPLLFQRLAVFAALLVVELLGWRLDRLGLGRRQPYRSSRSPSSCAMVLIGRA